METNQVTNGKVRIGIFGCGNIVKTIHLPVLLNTDKAEISFLYDVNNQKSERLGNSFNLPFIKNEEDIKWNEVDCFLIATPYGARKDLYKKIASRANKNSHLLIEKPVVLSRKDIQTLKDEDLFGRSHSGFMRRHYLNTNILKDFISDGKMFKDIKKINISEGFKTMATSFESSSYHVSGALSGGGILAETGCHLLDQIDYILPDADYEVVSCSIIYDGDIDVHVEAEMNLLKNRIKVPVSVKFSRLERVSNQISIDLGEMNLSSGVSPSDKVSLILDNSAGESYSIGRNLAFAINSYQAFYLEWASIIEDIVSGKPSINRLSKTFRVGTIIESLYDYSKRKGTFKSI